MVEFITTIEADGVTLLVVDGMDGPVVRRVSEAADALCWVLNNASRGVLRDLREHLLRGEEIHRGGLFVERPDPGDVDRARERWIELTGKDPGTDDVYVAGVAELGNELLVPRMTLLRLCEQLDAVRRTWLPPAPSALGAVPEGAVAMQCGPILFYVLESVFGAGLYPVAPVAEPLCWLINGAAGGLVHDLGGALRRADPVHAGSVFAVKASADDPDPNALDAWKRLTGRHPGRDLYLVGVADLGPGIIVPRAMLIRLHEQFEAVRRVWRPRIATWPLPPSAFLAEPSGRLEPGTTIIETDGIRLGVRDTFDGAAVFSLTPETFALCWLLNNAAHGIVRDVPGALERGDRIEGGGVFAARPDLGEAAPAARERWRRLTGRDPGDDVYVVRVVDRPGSLMVPRRSLMRLLERFEAVRRAWPVPMGTSRDPEPEQGPFQVSRDELGELDHRAAALDSLDRAARSDDDRAAVAAKRRFLLLDLEHAGLLDAHRQADRVGLLDEWGHDALLSYQDASARLFAYLASDARRRVLPPVEEERVRGASVSLDWFRLEVPAPDELEPDVWLAHCEQALHLVRDELAGASGDVIMTWRDRTYRLGWRTDDGRTPALIWARLDRAPS